MDVPPHGTIVLPNTLPNGGISRFLSTVSYNRRNTLRTEIGPQLQSFNLPRRLFVWIYSVSLVILMIIWLVLVAVTIIDVIKQTSSASFKGVKLFFVIIICVVFIVISILLYFLRLYQRRVSMNDIPMKSAYIPFQGDMPNRAYRHIDKRLRQCCEIKTRASPLHNEREVINYPGLSPPEYIQHRNKDGGNLLPPNLNYQEVVHSLSDRFNRFDSFNSAIKAPKYYTFREICIYLTKDLLENKNLTQQNLPNVSKFIELYEKFRFGPGLIEEREMLEFMVYCSDFSGTLLQHYGAVYAYRQPHKRGDKYGSSLNQAFTRYSTERSDYNFGYSEFSDSDDEHHPLNQPDKVSAARTDNEGAYTDDQSVKLTRYEPTTSQIRLRPLTRKSTNSSQGSTIRNKLLLFSETAKSTVSFQELRRRNSLRVDKIAFSRINSHNSNFTRNSGYNSDVEEGSEPDGNSFAERSEESDGGVYNFRRRSAQPPEIPQLVVEPVISSSAVPSVSDIQIKRLKSPEKRFLRSRLRSRLNSPNPKTE